MFVLCSFAGGRLTFLKLGSASAGFGGCVWNFFGKPWVANPYFSV